MSEIYRSAEGAALIRERYLNTLKYWPVEHERLRVPTPEGETFVLASGPADAAPLILLHGSGSNALSWMDRIPVLAQHFRTYSVDVIGEPGLSAPSRPPLDSDRYATWLEAVLRELGVPRAAFLGISLGGWLGLDLAIRKPELVERLALSSPLGLGRNRSAYLFRGLLLNLLGKRGRRRSLTTVLGAGLATVPGAELVMDTMLIMGRHYRYRTGNLPRFGDGALSGLNLPVHASIGAQDVMFDAAEAARRLERFVPDARVDLLPGIGHFVPARIEEELRFLTAGADRQAATELP